MADTTGVDDILHRIAEALERIAEAIEAQSLDDDPQDIHGVDDALNCRVGSVCG